MARQVSRGLDASDRGRARSPDGLVHGQLQAGFPLRIRCPRMADGRYPGPAPSVSLAGDDRPRGDHRLCRQGLAARRLLHRLPALHGDRRLLGREHVDPGAGQHVGAAFADDRVCPRAARLPVPLGPPHHRADARRHADGADVRLSHSDPDPLRHWSRGRHGGVRDLCQSAHGPQYPARPAAGTRQCNRERPDVRVQRLPAPVHGAHPRGDSDGHDRCEPDHHGSPSDGDHRRHHRRLRRHRLGRCSRRCARRRPARVFLPGRSSC